MAGGLRVLLVSFVLSAGVAWGGASPADAAAACTANATFAYAPGITVVPAPNPGVTGTLVLNCPVLAGDAGMWIIPFAGVSPLESCELGNDTVLMGPALPGFGPAGLAGPMTFTHGEGGLAALTATLTWPGNTRTLLATGVWLPVLVPGNCVTAPVTGGFFTGAGALAI